MDGGGRGSRIHSRRSVVSSTGLVCSRTRSIPFRGRVRQHSRRKLVFERRKHDLTRLLFLDGGAINHHFSF